MDPKNPEQPRRTSQPTPQQPDQPSPPMEAPGNPNTEYERQVPHEGNQPIARTATGGEGSYEGTQRYDNGMDQFSKQHSLEDSIADAKQIDTSDPALGKAEKQAKQGPAKGKADKERASIPSVH